MTISKDNLDHLYSRYNKLKFIHPDPLEFIYQYSDSRDREIVGLIVSSLAYGNVKQILKSITVILKKMDSSPYSFLLSADRGLIEEITANFKHRFTDDKDMLLFLLGVQEIIYGFGSIENCFISCYKESNSNFLATLDHFSKKINSKFQNRRSFLIPSPNNGSPCKRLMLYLRWMIRKDSVDPGCWSKLYHLRPKLIIPLDTHIHKIALIYNLTTRKNCSLKTAMEITNYLKKMDTKDPVKYDFVLSRLGIRKELNYQLLSNH